MPLLNLRLTNTDGSNRCVVDLPHEIRTQDMRVKQTRVHYNHEDHATTTGNYHNKRPATCHSSSPASTLSSCFFDMP